MLEVVIIIGGVIVVTVLVLSFVFSPSYKKNINPERYCPVCRTRLNPGESVYGVLLSKKMPQKIEIQGCPHCLKKPSDKLDL